MKIKMCVLVCLLFALSHSVLSQGTKTAFVRGEEILNNMPEYKAAFAEIEQYSKQLEYDLSEKQRKIEALNGEYRQKAEEGLLTREMEQIYIDRSDNLIRELEASKAVAQQRLESKQSNTIKAVMDKFNSAVKAVGQRMGYDYVLDVNEAIYANPVHDLTNEVLKQLGI